MILLLVIDPGPLDFALENRFYTPESGFIGRNSYFLENVLHDWAKQLVIALGLLCLAALVGSFLATRLSPWRRPLGCLVLSLGLSTGIVTPLKVVTGVQCPWSLKTFGGTQAFSPLIGTRPDTDKPGRCWPGGHASSGFSLVALFFFLRDRRPRLARTALLLALALGSVLSIGRMMQGAHFLSHNLWTLLLDWTIAALCYRGLLYRPTIPRSQLSLDSLSTRLRS